MLRSGLLCGAAVLFVAAAAAGTANAKQQFTTFDPKGSIYTYAAAINGSGTVAGYYEDSLGAMHGFLRAPDGTITVFDPSGSTSTQAMGINDNGQVAGWYLDSSGTYHNFLRANDGTITQFDASKGYEPSAIGLNAKGKVAGWYYTYGYDNAGFVGMPQGKMTKLTVDGVAINSKGVVTGVDGMNGFVRLPSGKLTTFAGPGSANSTTPTSINDSGMVAGYDTSLCGKYYGFSRSPDGNVAAVDPPGSYYTRVMGVSDKGAMTGYYYDGAYHGFVLDSGGAYTEFDIAGDTYGTWPQAINSKGVVAGGYSDNNNVGHGFIGTP